MAAKTRTLYVREEDQALWDEAKELIGESLSAYLTNHLRSLVAEKKSMFQGTERIVLSYKDEGIPTKKAFQGKWLIGPDQAISIGDWFDEAEDFVQLNYTVAVTAKGKFVVHWKYSSDWGGMQVFENVNHIKAEGKIPNAVIGPLVEIVGVEVEELDI